MTINRQIFLDTETTGLDPTKGHRLTEIGCLEMINRRLTGRSFHSYLNPEREMDAAALEITGLTLEFLLDKPKFPEIVDDFLEFVQDGELIIHNAPFDVSFINTELQRIAHPSQNIESIASVFDTLALARELHPGQKNNLDALCKRYGVDNSHRTYHGALLDAEILSKVYLLMTAGQTDFGSLTENTQEQILQAETKRRRLKRSENLNLTVIRATEEELQLHELRMRRLQQSK